MYLTSSKFGFKARYTQPHKRVDNYHLQPERQNLISVENKHKCSIRCISTDELEITASIQLQQYLAEPDDWNLFIEVLNKQVQKVISTIEILRIRKNRYGTLTRREQQMLSLIDAWLTDKTIVENLNISRRAARTYRNSICKKLRISSYDDISKYRPFMKQTNNEGLETVTANYVTKPFNSSALRTSVRNPTELPQILSAHNGSFSLGPEDAAIASENERFMKQVIGILKIHGSDADFNTNKFSSEIGMSRSQLHRKIKALTGRSTGRVIRFHRLNSAKRLIQKNFGNMAQVSYECGFNNPSYFAECFKKQFGVLPSQYAKSQQT